MLKYTSIMSIEHIRPREIINLGQPDTLLINVPATFQQGIIPDDEEPPFGMLRIAVASEEYGYKPALLDAHRGKLTPSEIDDVLYGLKPKSVGINPTSVNVPEAQEIAELCAHHGIPLILGGVHATLDPFTALKEDFPMALAVVKGKGEKAILHILDDIKNGQRTEKRGVYYQNAETSRRDFADYYPLDELPLIDQSRWVENPLIGGTVGINGQNVELIEISLYETAGCPFQCTYCATPALVGRNDGYKTYYRPNMDRILASTKLAVELGANAIHFIDDMAFVNPSHFRKFADGVEKLKLQNQLYWRGMTRASIIADKCSDEDLSILAQSGCWRIAMGVESGDEQILRRIKKGITTHQVREAVSKLRAVGIPQVKAFFIMGFPEETLEQMETTRKFIMELKQLGLTDISIFQFKPYPGTEEWQHLQQTNPEVLENLYYIRHGGSTNIVNRKIAKDASLPDDLKIAAVPSKIVREMVVKTLEEFYGH